MLVNASDTAAAASPRDAGAERERGPAMGGLPDVGVQTGSPTSTRPG